LVFLFFDFLPCLFRDLDFLSLAEERCFAFPEVIGCSWTPAWNSGT